MIAVALLISLAETALLRTTASFLSLIKDIAFRNSTNIVTVLIPPAVPTGDPPMNIYMQPIRQVDGVSAS